MASSRIRLSVSLAVLSLIAGEVRGQPETTRVPPNTHRALSSDPPAQPFGALPLTFIENQGQLDGQVLFVARRGAMTAYFTRSAFVLRVERREDACSPER